MGLVGSLLLALLFAVTAGGSPEPKVPAIYVFGDSTADVGNNNYLTGNVARADYSHYGIDFPHSRPTGRFSNGYNTIDFLAINMGFRRSPPPYLSLTNKANHKISRGLQGVNFASGGSGILDSTGVTISMRKQIQYFQKLQSEITATMEAKLTKSLLSKSIFLISSGGNDVFAFYTQKASPSKSETKQFMKTLMSNYSEHLKDLYSLGARKFMLIDVGVIGCCPFARAMNPLEECIDVLNDLAVDFNKAVKVLMSNLSSTLHGMKYSIGSSYAVISRIIANPTYHGHLEVKYACCGAGKLKAQTRCDQNTSYCTDRDHYLFWDMLHPTHSTSKKVGLAIYDGSLDFASPINGMQLVEADSEHRRMK